MRILTILFITFLISSKSFACDCKKSKNLKEIQNREFENSECIFIGEVLKIDAENNTFEIKVIESFSGDENGKTYSGIYDAMCGPIIDENGKWLIYANYNAKNLIKINACGLTRSFDNPQRNAQTFVIIPPPEKKLTEIESKKRYEKFESESKVSAKLDLKLEIEILRNKTK